MDIHVPESERRWLRAVLVLGTLVLALLLLAQISVILAFFSDLLLILLLAWLLAFILSPVIGLIERAFPRLPRAAAVGLVYLVLLVGIGTILVVLAGSLATSIQNFLIELPNLQARLPEILAPLQNTLTGLGFQLDLVTAARDLLISLGDIGDELVQPLTDLAIFSLGIVGNLFIVIFLSLFILLDRDRILAYANRLVPPRYSETARVFESSVSTSFGGFIRGSVIQGVIMAGIAAGAHLVLGLDFLPASAALSGVLQAIPFFGPFFSWIPPVLVAILTKPDALIPTLVIMGIGWFVVSNIITPRVMAQAVGIHPIVVLVSVLVGAKVAGIAGAIFAVPFAAILASFFQHFLARNVNAPRDVTSRAARRVGEREGRRVRVPTPPAVGIGGTRDSAPPKQATKPAEPSG
jgi:predicted PurR-regulated permease PerM